MLLPRSSAVEVAAPPSAIGLGLELSLKLHEGPDPGAVGADVRLDLGGRLADPGQVDAEQLRAPPPAAPPSAVPGQGRAKSPLTQTIEHQFEDQSSISRTTTGATLSRNGRVSGIPRSGLFARSSTFANP